MPERPAGGGRERGDGQEGEADRPDEARHVLSPCLGEPTDRAREVYRTVLAALEAAEVGVRAGITGKEADKLARDVITEAGFGEYFGHGLGHGVGIQVHEAPSAGHQFDTPLTAGSTLTIEPGIYIPDWGGVRIEDLVVIETEGVRVLSKAAKQVV